LVVLVAVIGCCHPVVVVAYGSDDSRIWNETLQVMIMISETSQFQNSLFGRN
jgi:hypothetical protein